MATQVQHTLRAFDEDIDELRAMVAEIGELVISAIGNAMTALETQDEVLAARVVANDETIDKLEHRIDNLAIQTIALRAPMADDLRELIATLKISGVVERIGDYAKNIAKRVPSFSGGQEGMHQEALQKMAYLSAELVSDAIDAYARRDAALAQSVWERDQKIDNYYSQIFRGLIDHMSSHPRMIGDATHILFIGKYLERIGDHATNVAEMVYYAATGKVLPEREKGSDALV